MIIGESRIRQIVREQLELALLEGAGGIVPVTLAGWTIASVEDACVTSQRLASPPDVFVGNSPAWYKTANGGKLWSQWRKTGEYKEHPGKLYTIGGQSIPRPRPGAWVIIPALWGQPGARHYGGLARVHAAGLSRTTDGRDLELGWVTLRFLDDPEGKVDGHRWSTSFLREVAGPTAGGADALGGVEFYFSSGLWPTPAELLPHERLPPPAARVAAKADPDDDRPMTPEELRRYRRAELAKRMARR